MAKDPKSVEETSTSTTRRVSAQDLKAKAAATTGKRSPVSGYRLIKIIRKRLIDDELPERTISDILGVTSTYWNSMCNGNRQIKSLPKPKMANAAEFLGISVVQAYTLSEFFEPKDFLAPVNLDSQLWLSIEKMTHDPQWASLAPTKDEWNALPLNIRIGYAALYERNSAHMLAQLMQQESAQAPAPQQESECSQNKHLSNDA